MSARAPFLGLGSLLLAWSLSAQLISGPAAAPARWPVIGDVNGDGLADVIDDTAVQLNAGGKLLPPSRLAISGWVVDALDVNGDGVADLLVTADPIRSMTPSGPFAIALNDGHGAFTSLAAPLPASGADGVFVTPLIADFDGDGKDDLIVPFVHRDGAHDIELTFYRSRGDGTFTQTAIARIAGGTIPVIASPSWMRQHVAAGDLDGDGNPDIAMIGYDGLVVLFGRGGGTFGDAVTRYLPAPQYGFGNGMHIADIDGDGRNDLVWADTSAHVRVLFGDGHGGFARTATGSTSDTLEDSDHPRTVALLHASSATRFDVAVGAPGRQVVVLTYANGRFSKVARTQVLSDPAPVLAGETPIVEANVFAGNFRGGSARDLYAFESSGWQAQDAGLLFVDITPAHVPSHGHAAGRPGLTTPKSDSLSLRIAADGCALATDTWAMTRDGVFAKGVAESNGNPVEVFFESDDTMYVKAVVPNDVLTVRLARVAPGHYVGTASPMCGAAAVTVDATVR